MRETITSKDYTALQFYLSNPYFDPNILNKDGFSALHLFAKNEDCNGIEILMKDPRIDFSIEDITQHLASHYIDKSKLALKELLHSMSVRGTLDILTKQECAHIQSFFKKEVSLNTLFILKLAVIKSKLSKTAATQNQDTDKTREFKITWPNYATDDFMIQKFWFIISSLTNAKKTSEENGDSISISTTSSESLESSQPLKPTKHSPPTRSKTADTSSKPKEITLLTSSISVLERISPRAKSPKNSRPHINDLSDAIRNCDLDTFMAYINNPDSDLNQKDQWGSTALHRAVLSSRETTNNRALISDMIDLLLRDPRTNTSILNDKNLMASQLLKGGEFPELRVKLFARNSIDIAINTEIGKIIFNDYISNISLHDEQIKQIAKNIRDKIVGIEIIQEQNNRPLPKESKLPEWATNDFIFSILKRRIPSSENITELHKKALKDIFSQEIEKYLLKTADESLEIIKKAINSDKVYAYLIPFTLYIFHALKELAEEKRETTKCMLKYNFST